jgi:uncharacterized membrane protein
MSTVDSSHAATPTRAALVLAALAVVFVAWFVYAPAGLLGKADAVGYAICHRISVRSFFIGEIQMPLCARCTGIYLGVVVGVAILIGAGRWRSGNLPPTRVIAAVVLFIGVMGVDGVNSYLTLIPGLPYVYQPQNWLRLATGILAGVAVSGLIFPVFNSTLWKDWQATPGVRSLRELFGILLVAMALAGMILSNIPILLFPLALISSGGVLLLMTLTNSVIFMLATRTENRARSWREAVIPLAAGLTIALTLIFLIDVLRYTFTGTWDGFVIPIS